MNKNNQTMRPKNVFSRFAQGILLACLMLGFGFAELQAQEVYANYYNSINGDVVNEITVNPGESFTVVVGIDVSIPFDGVTASMNFDPSVLTLEGIDDLIQFVLPLPLGVPIVDNENGYLSFSKAGFVPAAAGNYQFMGLNFVASADIVYNTTVEISHLLEGNNMSQMTANAAAIEGSLTPSVMTTVFTGVDAPDCLDLGLNIGDECTNDDGDLGTVNDLCECEIAVTGPENDLACNAIALSCGDVATGNNENATNTAENCGGSGGTGGLDVWYSFTADELSIVTLETCSEGTNFDTDLNVYTGECGALECFAGFSGNGYSDFGDDNDCETSDWAANDSFTAEAGVTYTIRLSGYNDTEVGDFALSISCALYDCPENPDGPVNNGDACDDGDDLTINDMYVDCNCVGEAIPDAPENDLACNAIALECNATVTGSTVSATNSASNCGGGGSANSGPDVWYTFMADVQTIVTLGTCDPGTQFDTDLNVYTGECSALECFGGFSDDGYTDFGASNDCETSSWAANGEFTAMPGVMYTIRLSGYGVDEFGDYALTVSCVEVVCESPSLDLAVVDASGAPITADCVDAGVEFWVSATLSGGSGNASYNVSANGGDAVVVDADGSTSFGPYAAGTDVTVDAVGADDAICGASETTTLVVCPPDNDTCADAIAVECGSTTAGTTVNASPESQEFCGTGDGTGGAVWYTLTLDYNATVTLGLCDADYDSKLRVFSGSCDALTCITGVDDECGNDPTFDIDAEAGVTYYLLVHGFSSSEGNFDLTVECVESFDCPDYVDGPANIGDDCDDGDDMTENDMIDENCGCSGTPVVVYDCPDYVDGPANIGDLCDDGDDMTENDMIDANCGCTGTPIVPSDCQEWVMYMNDNEGGETDVYGVDISGGDAELTFLVTLDFHAHIAYNEEDNMLYVVENQGSHYVIVNPHVSPVTVSAPIMLDDDMPSITTAAFANGKLVIGSSTQDVIYSVDLTTNVASVYDGYAPISGGDIAFRGDGKPYLASRSGNGLYEIWPEDMMIDDTYVGGIANLVTGMVFNADSDVIITSHNGNADLQMYNSADASPAGAPLALMLDDMPFMHHNGDLAAGCNSFNEPNEGDCDDFSTFYSHYGSGTGVVGSDIYKVTYSGANAMMEFVTNVDFGAHIAFNGQDGLLYLVNPNGSFVRVWDVALGVTVVDLPIVGSIDQLFAVVYNDEDGMLYVGDANSDKLHTIDLVSGVATEIGDAPVAGGDLAMQDGSLYLANRSNADLYEIVAGVPVLVGDMPAANGMAQANNATGLIVANPGSSDFIEINAADGTTVQSFTAMLGGMPLTLADGDMAAGCGDDEPVIIPDGECYATEVMEYVEGSAMGGGSIPAERADASQALGAPERTDELVFVALGYGGSLTVGFGGSVPNEEGDDIEIVETSFNSAGCAAYPEFADVYVSVDGIDWYLAATGVCKAQPFVDISDAGDFDYVMYVKVVNTDAETTSSDGLDVDGIVALHNCEDDGSGNGETGGLIVDSSVMTSFPNPTTGPSQVIFTTGVTGRTLVEVYDMNGRNVETLFNQVAQEGHEYRLDFNGNDLPNGVYVYKMTTNNETIVNKFMIAK